MRVLKALVILMSFLILAGLALLVWGMAVKFGKLGKTDAPVTVSAAAPAGTTGEWPADVAVALPQGATVAETAIGDGRMAVRLALPDGGQRILVFDLATGRRVGAVDFVSGETVQ